MAQIIKVLERETNTYTKLITLCNVSRDYAQLDEGEKALECANLALKGLKSGYNATDYNSNLGGDHVVWLYAILGKHDSAFSASEWLVHPIERIQGLGYGATTCVHQGDSHRANEYLRRLMAIADTSKDKPILYSSAVVSVSEEFFSLGDGVTALKLLDKALEVAEYQKDDAWVFANIAIAYANLGFRTKPLKICSNITDPNDKILALRRFQWAIDGAAKR